MCACSLQIFLPEFKRLLLNFGRLQIKPVRAARRSATTPVRVANPMNTSSPAVVAPPESADADVSDTSPAPSDADILEDIDDNVEVLNPIAPVSRGASSASLALLHENSASTFHRLARGSFVAAETQSIPEPSLRVPSLPAAAPAQPEAIKRKRWSGITQSMYDVIHIGQLPRKSAQVRVEPWSASLHGASRWKAALQRIVQSTCFILASDMMVLINTIAVLIEVCPHGLLCCAHVTYCAQEGVYQYPPGGVAADA